MGSKRFYEETTTFESICDGCAYGDKVVLSGNHIQYVPEGWEFVFLEKENKYELYCKKCIRIKSMGNEELIEVYFEDRNLIAKKEILKRMNDGPEPLDI